MNNRMKTRIGKPLPLLLATVLVGSLAGPVRASVDVAPGSVGEAGKEALREIGEVSLVVGKAWIVHDGAKRERIRKGTRISVNDAIETSSNGHVHVHFVDGALVSVRPASLLEVLRYDYNAAQPTLSAVRFDLKEGVLRAISGEAAKHARENFRLNTPIAAIGVRGTDFVVSADQDSLSALVTEGAIVVTRYSADCIADGFTACNQNGFELAGGGGQIMQLTANAADAVLLPLASANVPATVAGVATTSDETQDEPEKTGSGDIADTVTTRVVNQTIADNRSVQPPETPPSPPPIISEPPPPPPPPFVPPPLEFTPIAAIATTELTSEARQLVWGRYAASDANERITVHYDPSNTQLFPDFGVSGNNHYSLFRRNDDKQLVQPGLGIVGFNLDKAQAQYTAGGVTSMMNVNGGSLTIDFGNNRFATNLSLNHAATGPVSIIVDNGQFSAGGHFHSRTDMQVVAGAVTLDGKEAGYFFEKTLENGNIEGLTLWGSKP